MIAAFLSLLAVILGFQLFTITTNLTAINRIVITTPLALFETSIPLINNEEDAPLYFDKRTLEDNLSVYYSNALEKYTKKFSLDFYYYHQEDDSYCIDDKCNAVEVDISALITFDFSYHRVMFYEIKEMTHGY
ncbi:MAG: hypothetical protein PHI75_01310 [Bacilli bacterium]|jgi:hypothetical protein|nr:hypothetical protein [Bacilli bacterium]MDD3068840.1 hypothetical protein [Bacilli bacterium]MDD3841341.1 hypothetical protein [Bacilli bacterium]HKM10609.1 hypothetical protein [Bacilli bacterium]